MSTTIQKYTKHQERKGTGLVCTGEQSPGKTLQPPAHPRQYHSEHYSDIQMDPADKEEHKN